MDGSELERFRAILLEKREDLLDRVRSARSTEAEGNEEDAPDLGDRAITTISRDLMYQLTVGERDILRRIDLALERLDKGVFGACVHCGKQVQIARLEAVPWARHCISCQELQDRGDI
jgi:DnaK suppressor protein